MSKYAPAKVKSSGFTLIEMMIVIAIIVVVASIAVPSFVTLMNNQKVRKGTIDTIAAFQQARSEAAVSGRATALAFDTSTKTFSIKYSNPLNTGTPVAYSKFIIDEDLEVTTENMPANLVVLPTGQLGTALPSGVSKIVYRICNNDSVGEGGYTVWINSLGMVRAAGGPQSFTPASAVAAKTCE